MCAIISTVGLLTVCVAAGSPSPQPQEVLVPPANATSLPLPPHDIPSNLQPPLAHGRNDVHGWLWLPVDVEPATANGSVQSTPTSQLRGWFYHHTPEFWKQSPHNFEIMTFATLALDHAVADLPLPPAADVLGTEYVFTPPAFSLDEMITRKALSFYGHFTNGSFDTKQYIWLSNGTIHIDEMTTVHYLWDDNHTAVSPMSQQAYLSYPRVLPRASGTADPKASRQVPDSSPSTSLVHLYWLHMLRRAPDFDQIVHVVVDTTSCEWRHGDTVDDATAVGATFGTSLENTVLSRLHDGTHTVELFTDAGRMSKDKTTCTATVLEEVHCVVMPDSFAKCPQV